MIWMGEIEYDFEGSGIQKQIAPVRSFIIGIFYLERKI